MEDGLTTANGEGDYKPDLPALKRMYEESQSLTFDARVQEQKDGDYYDGYQLTAAEKRILRGRKQPDNIWNFTRLAVNGTLGVIKQGSTDPRAYPRNPQDEDSADVASKTLMYVADAANFDATKIDFAKDYLVPGTGAVIIGVDDDLKVTIEPIRREEFFYDPRSRRQDFTDARFMGIAKWAWASDLKAEYPGKKDDIDRCFGGSDFLTDDLTEDRPRDGTKSVAWVHKRELRVMVVEIYYREGRVWRRCKFTAGVELESGPSAYLDDKKQPICPIEAQSCYVDRENNRMGIVRDMRGPQDEINKRSSKLLFELTARQVQEISPGSGMGEADDVRKEAARPDGVLPAGWQIVPRQDIVTGQAALLANAHQAMSRFSPNPAILGREGENQSGRANQVRQQAGMTEQAIVFGGIEEWELRCYRQMWNRARQYWTGPMFIRVTDDEGAPDFIGINQPPQGPDGQPLPMMPDPQAQPDASGQVPPLMQQGKPVFQGPDGQPVLGYENSLAELDVDITLDTTPDVANLQAEQFALMTELAKMYGPQEIPFEDLLEVSTMPNKRKVIEKRKARAEEGQKGQQESPQAQLAMQGAMTELAKLKAEVDKLKADTELALAKAESERAKPEIEAAKIMQAGDQHAMGLDHQAAMKGAEMQQQDAHHQDEAAFRGAEMDQADNQFAGQMNHAERLAQMKAEQTPPPGE